MFYSARFAGYQIDFHLEQNEIMTRDFRLLYWYPVIFQLIGALYNCHRGLEGNVRFLRSVILTYILSCLKSTSLKNIVLSDKGIYLISVLMLCCIIIFFIFIYWNYYEFNHFINSMYICICWTHVCEISLLSIFLFHIYSWYVGLKCCHLQKMWETNTIGIIFSAICFVCVSWDEIIRWRIWFLLMMV